MALLITVANLKLHNAMSGMDSDLATDLITAASDWVERYCNRVFTSAEFTEVHDGDGSRSMFLRNIPITALNATTVTQTDSNDDTYTNASTDFDYDGAIGELRFKSSAIVDGDYAYFLEGFQNQSVVYTAGYSEIPQPIQQAVAQIVLAMFRPSASKRNPGLKSEKLGDWSGTKFDNNTVSLSPAVKMMLAPYVIHEVGRT